MTTEPALSPSKSSTAFLTVLSIGVLLINLFVAGVVALSLWMSRAQYDAQAAVTTQNLSQVLNEYISGAIDKIDLALLAVEDEVEKQLATGRVDGQALNKFIARQYAHQFAHQPDLDGLRVTNARGDVLYGVGVPDAAGGAAVDRDYFTQLQADHSAGLVFSKPMLGKNTGNWVVILARGVTQPDGSFGGVVYAGILLENFAKLLPTIDLGRNGVVTLRDSKMGIVVQHPEPHGTQGGYGAVGDSTISTELRALIETGQDLGTFYTPTSHDNVPRMASYRKITGYPFYIIVALATDDYLAEWRSDVVKMSTLVSLFALITVVLSWMIYRAWRIRAVAESLEHQVQERTAQLRALTVELTMAEERERHLIAQDLHDGLGQVLAMAKLKLTALETADAGEGHDDLKRQIKDIEEMLDQANMSVRSLSLQLSPPVLHQLGLIPALEWLSEDMQRAYGLHVRIVDDGKPKPLGEALRNTVFRAVRELLINVWKHADVDAAEVAVSIDDERLLVTVSDNGAGFDLGKPVTQSATGGYGLFSVRERVGFMGGEMHIDSKPGHGTLVVLNLPLETQSKEAGT
jgi:signal transduction histidine kinase